MISLKELLLNRVEFKDLPKEHQDNLNTLLERINKVRAVYGKPMKVNDGYRRLQDTPKNGSATSWHYKGAAVDIDDNDAGDFAKWVVKNLKLMQEVGLWIEDVRWTNGCGSWVHFQIYPPKSGKRVFIPSTKPACNPKIWDGKYDPIFDKESKIKDVLPDGPSDDDINVTLEEIEKEALKK
jgi:hypothetical protein